MIRFFLIISLVCCTFGSAFATDPPRLNDYKQKILNSLPKAFLNLDKMYYNRFVADPPIESPTGTINKSPVYYDALKNLHEINELFHDRTGLTAEEIALLNQIPSYMTKAKKILATRYITAGGSGYQAFPHGLFYTYQQSGDTESLNALIGLRDIGNLLKINPAHERIEYSRDIAYSLNIFITSLRAGIPREGTPDNATLLANFLRLVKSHVNQWATGNFYYDPNATYTEYMAPFIAGLSLAALIEYYEYIAPDPTIPPLVKSLIDVIWDQAWWPDVANPYPTTVGDTYANYSDYTAGYGAFWHWLNWDEATQRYIPDTNNMPSSADINADNIMLLGHAYAWYGAFSGNKAYIDKSLSIFNAVIENAWFGDAMHVWEGNRMFAAFLRYYRKFYGTPCSANNLDMCSTKEDCQSASGNWTGELCQHAPVTNISSPHICEDISTLCSDQISCETAGWNWCSGGCQECSGGCQEVPCNPTATIKGMTTIK